MLEVRAICSWHYSTKEKRCSGSDDWNAITADKEIDLNLLVIFLDAIAQRRRQTYQRQQRVT